MSNYMRTLAGILLTATMVSGCSTTHSGSEPSNSLLQNQTAVTPSVTENNTPGSVSNTAETGNTSVSGTPSGSSSTAPADSGQSDQAATALIQESMQKAEQGIVVGIPFAVQTSLEAVQKSWGSISKQDTAGAGIYVNYSSHNAAFGINKGEQIFDVRSYSPSFQSLTLKEIENVLGSPGEIRESADSYIYMYPAGPNNQILWVFPKLKNGQSSETLDHVSVFWPQGTVNSMAATQPAPGVVIDKNAGGENRVTFSIANPPKGYRLVELEWLSNNGKDYTADTYAEIKGATTNRGLPGFVTNADGTTFSYVYSPSMKGQIGHLQVIYQTTSGTAMIGQSQDVTLA
jgi:hypothetical protein